jgi:hypothetical protein
MADELVFEHASTTLVRMDIYKMNVRLTLLSCIILNSLGYATEGCSNFLILAVIKPFKPAYVHVVVGNILCNLDCRISKG